MRAQTFNGAGGSRIPVPIDRNAREIARLQTSMKSALRIALQLWLWFKKAAWTLFNAPFRTFPHLFVTPS
jgi:hypothetical protein